ncbi:serpin family protein [Amycolatopsis lexingtonensis]|uniref:serpin family protein n=1 Tax=Amycolatopsis lexingtonensis TaxID=218822 RepID=UPI003B8477D4
MFGDEADLSGLSPDPRLTVSEVLHQAVLRVDEHGAHAQAAQHGGQRAGHVE